MAQASWLEIQHWGQAFIAFGDKIALPGNDQPAEVKEMVSEASMHDHEV